MANETYAITENGEIEIIDSRKFTRGTIVLDYIIHLYGPIITFTGLGFYTTVLSLSSKPKTYNKLHGYMKHGGVGWKVLKDQLDLMERLGFWKVEYPTGKDKRSHKRTTIELLDVPTKVPTDLVQYVLDRTIVRDWLFVENVSTEKQLGDGTPTDVFGEPVVGPTVQAEKKAKAETKTTKPKKEASVIVPQIIKLYYDMLPVPRQKAFQGGLEGKAAVLLEKYGYSMGWSIETLLEVIETCWRENDPRWMNGLNLQNLYTKVLPNWVYRHPEYNTVAPSVEDATDTLPLTPGWKELKPEQKAFWVVGNRYPCSNNGTWTVEIVDGELVCWHEQEERITLRGKTYGFGTDGTSA